MAFLDGDLNTQRATVETLAPAGLYPWPQGLKVNGQKIVYTQFLQSVDIDFRTVSFT